VLTPVAAITDTGPENEKLKVLTERILSDVKMVHYNRVVN